MALRQETIVRAELRRVADTLHNEEISVRPYVDQYRRLLDNHGKMIRPSLALTFAMANVEGQGPLSQRVITGAAAIEMLHLATLVHDDVLDGAPIRRNESTVQTVVGNKAAIYLGDLILSRYMEIIGQIAPNIAFVREHSSTVYTIVTGELMQESARHDTGTTIDHYMKAITGKTAALFRLACLTGLQLNGTEPDEDCIRAVGAFGTHLGTAFQIVDDLEDFNVGHDTGKPKLEDIADGIYTLPVLLALRDDAGFGRVMENGGPKAVLRYLTNHPEPIAQSRAIAARHVNEARQALAGVPMREPVRAWLTAMLERFLSNTVRYA